MEINVKNNRERERSKTESNKKIVKVSKEEIDDRALAMDEQYKGGGPHIDGIERWRKIRRPVTLCVLTYCINCDRCSVVDQTFCKCACYWIKY